MPLNKGWVNTFSYASSENLQEFTMENYFLSGASNRTQIILMLVMAYIENSLRFPEALVQLLEKGKQYAFGTSKKT